MPEASREVFEGAGRILPELVMLGHHRRNTARVPGLGEHSHPELFEVFYVDRGSVELRTESEVHCVGGGEAHVTRPGEIHGSAGRSLKPCAYFWLQFSPLESAVHDPQSPIIRSQLSSLTRRCFPASAEVRTCFLRLLQEARNLREGRGDVLSPVVCRAVLHLLLSTLVRDANVDRSHGKPSALIHRATTFIERNLERDISSTQLAGTFGLSAAHFHGRFLAETGFTPHTYIVRRRIERAKSLLARSGSTITVIAHSIGFSSSQHFATAFRKIEGLSPTAYRDQLTRAGTRD